jgi:hypothetical protein
MTEESLGTDVEVILGAHPCAESADSVSLLGAHSGNDPRNN